MITLLLPTLRQTQDIARRIAHLAKPQDIITLRGDLGSGKTEFARAFIRSLTYNDMVVPSPTFTLVEIYETTIAPIWHFDLYRLESEQEIWNLGIEEAFAQGISLIEWPEKLGTSFSPKNYLEIWLMLHAGSEERELTLTPHGTWESRIREIEEGARHV